MARSKILLVNPPWAALQSPSIALEQLATVVRERRDLDCDVDVRYLNHVVGAWLGVEEYAFLSESPESHNSGFGEWFFRAAAFPDQPENWTTYRKRYLNYLPAERRARVDRLVETLRPRLVDRLEDWLSSLDIDRYLLVGFTSLFQQNTASLALARLLKRRRPDLLVAIGGANCEGTMGVELVHGTELLDFAFSGHALESFPTLIEAVLSGDHESVHRIDGVLTRRNCRPASRGSTEPERIGIREVGRERPLDQVVELDYDEFLSSYTRHLPDTSPRPELFFETSRGCWWGQRAHCTFCGLNGSTMAYRAMKPTLARDYLGGLIERYSHRVGRFFGVDSILPKEYVHDLFSDFVAPPEVSIFYEVKADLGRSELRTLAAAGIREMQPGIEALYTPTLKLMRKGTTSMQNLSFLDDCGQLAVQPFWNLLVGFPGEAEDAYQHYQRSLPLLHHLPPPSGVFPVRFDRFSPYFVQAEHYGLDLAPLDFYRFVYPFPEPVFQHLAYYFRDRNIRAEYIQVVARWIGVLGPLVGAWQTRYHGRDGQVPARLDADRGLDGTWTVIDTRSGRSDSWTAPPSASSLIDKLQRPTVVTSLTDEQVSALDALRSRRLVFEERGNAMSLVRTRIHDTAAHPIAWERGGTRAYARPLVAGGGEP